MRGWSRPQTVCFAVLMAAILLAPFVVYPVFVMNVLCFALFACAVNLLVGHVGLLSLGHAAYFGIGSYVAAYLTKNFGASGEIAVLAGGLAGGVLGVVFGWVAIRRQGIYFAMITLALAQMIYFVCVEVPYTGGEDGIQGVPRPPLLGVVPLDSDLAMYGATAVVFLAGFLLIHRVIHSPFGHVLRAIRQNEPRTVSLGYSVDNHKLVAFTLSAVLAGIAGGCKALVFGIATLTDVHWSMSGKVVLMTLLGGMGTVFGPVVGALIVVAMEYYLAPFGAWVTVVQGSIFILCVSLFRRGLVGELAAALRVRL